MGVSYYDLGDLVKVSGAFTDADDVAQDPAAVYVQIKTPAGTVTSYQYGVDADVVKAGTGSYYINVDADEVGLWDYRWYSTGSGQAADEGQFRVGTLGGFA
jgi:hypothetical protein